MAIVTVCKRCGVSFTRIKHGPRRYCADECQRAGRNAERYARIKLRYRNDPAYREQQKAQSLSRYYRNKMDGGM